MQRQAALNPSLGYPLLTCSSSTRPVQVVAGCYGPPENSRLNRAGRASTLLLVLERYPGSPVQRRFRKGRAPWAGASIPTVLALAGLWAGSGRAAQPVPAAQSAPAAQAAPVSGGLMVVEGGRFVGQTTPENARRDGLTVVDLSDDWLPYIFSEEPEKPQPLRPYLIDLANGRMRGGSNYARPREDRYFEAFGIFPSLNLVRRRLADSKRHACHEKVKDAVLEELSPKNVIPPEMPEKVPNPDPATVAEQPMILTGRTISPRPLTATEKRAVTAMQAHLRCEGLLPGGARAPRMDLRTVAGLQAYQRLLMLADNGSIDLETRTALLADSREHDFRALLRALRERVVDATGLLEDGSALGVLGEVQGACWTAPSSGPCPWKLLPSKPPPRGGRQDHRGAGSDRRGHPGCQPGAGLDVTRGRPREHAGGSSDAAAFLATIRAQSGLAQGACTPARRRRDSPAAAAALPRPQDGAAR
jgi:hypothetical protein